MKIAAIQMTSTPNWVENKKTVEDLLEELANQGVQCVLLPEYWPAMGALSLPYQIAQSNLVDEIKHFMAEVAQRYGIYLIGGTLPLPSHEPNKVYNTTLVFDPKGQCIARYDKIHLFGFTQHNEYYEEKATCVAGNQVRRFGIQQEQNMFEVGLSICYDIRFPELYRALAPVDLIVVPAAFTYITGQAHWEILLRARAIENQCYVLAAAQVGQHINGRRTWGHSMLIDPWGKIVSILPDRTGTIAGYMNQRYIQEVRQSLPALQHRVL